MIKVYHGSDHIIKNPVCMGGKEDNDYGNGFYTTEYEDRARSWAGLNGTPETSYVNIYHLDIDNLKVMDLNDHGVLAWIAEVVAHRGISDENASIVGTRLVELYKPDTNNMDIIKGYRADDSYTQVIEAFGGEVIKLSQVPVIAKTMEETGGDFIAAVKALKEEVLSKEDGIVFVDQLSNPANPLVHENTTGPEIWEDTDGKIDILVAGVGTGGTISGTGKYLKEKNPAIKIVAVQPGPDSRPGAENPEPDEIDGIHPFEEVPKSWVPDAMDTEIYDEYINVEAKDAYRVTRELAKTEGILVGSSSGAAVYAAEQVASRPENKGKRIVVIIPDTGLRYLSTKLFEKE